MVLFRHFFPDFTGLRELWEKGGTWLGIYAADTKQNLPPFPVMGVELGGAGSSGPRMGPQVSAREGEGQERTALKTQGSRIAQNRDRVLLCLLFAGRHWVNYLHRLSFPDLICKMGMIPTSGN